MFLLTAAKRVLLLLPESAFICGIFSAKCCKKNVCLDIDFDDEDIDLLKFKCMSCDHIAI